MMAGRPRKEGKREPNGRPQRLAEDMRQIDVQRSNLEARCRAMGYPITDANLIIVRRQLFGCSAGQTIARLESHKETQGRLWSAVTHMRRVQVAYDVALGAPNRHPKCLELLLPVDALEASPETPPVDDRSEDEKYRAAISGWMSLQGWLGYTDKAAASQAKAVCIDDFPVTDPTGLILALTCVSDGMNDKRMIWRGRG